MTSDDYNNESNVQTNCVRTYVDHVSSFIISLRRGNIESTERLTIEYRIYPTEQIGEYEVNRIQTKAKRNGNPDESWDESLKFLDDRIYSYIEKGGLFLPTKEVPEITKKQVITVVAVGAGVTGLFAVSTPVAIIKTAPIASAWVSKNYTAVSTALNDSYVTMSLESMIMAKKIVNAAKAVLAQEQKEIAELTAKIKRLKGN